MNQGCGYLFFLKQMLMKHPTIMTAWLALTVCSCGRGAQEASTAAGAGQPLTQTGRTQAATIPAEKAAALALQQFQQYTPEIEASHEGRMDLTEPHTGDFTGDGLPDVAIYFNLAPEGGGNAIVAQGLSLYENTGTGVKVIAGYDPDYLFRFDTIREGKIHVMQLEYAENDGHCCPSIQKPRTLTIRGNKAF